MKTTDSAMLVNQFIVGYPAATRDLSLSTVLSYRNSIVSLVTFTSNVHGKGPEALGIADITTGRVEELLGWLKSERINNPSTRNVRPVAIHSLFRYLCSQRPEHIFHSQQMLPISVKKIAQIEATYPDTAQTEELLAAPDATTAKGKRNLALLCLLYNNECWVQELAGVRVNNIHFTVSPSGNAYR